jgi:hypothetical protein
MRLRKIVLLFTTSNESFQRDKPIQTFDVVYKYPINQKRQSYSKNLFLFKLEKKVDRQDKKCG